MSNSFIVKAEIKGKEKLKVFGGNETVGGQRDLGGNPHQLHHCNPVQVTRDSAFTLSVKQA